MHLMNEIISINTEDISNIQTKQIEPKKIILHYNIVYDNDCFNITSKYSGINIKIQDNQKNNFRNLLYNGENMLYCDNESKKQIDKVTKQNIEILCEFVNKVLNDYHELL